MTIHKASKTAAYFVCIGLITSYWDPSPLKADEIRVYSGGAPEQILRAITPEFERSSGHQVTYTFALVTAIQQKLAAGEKADLVLLPIPLITATEKAVPLHPQGRQPLARVGIALIAREARASPDISTPENLKSVLLSAQKIALPEPSTPSGAHLQRILDQLGIAEAVRSKLQIKAAIHGGAELVANGEAEFGMYLLSEMQGKTGIQIVGLLPSSLQNFVVYGSAIPASNPSPEPAIAFIKFITDPTKADAWKRGGFEIIPR